MNNLCAVTSDLNRYLAREDHADAYNAAIEARAEELTKQGCAFYPFSEHNFSEALSESDLRETAWLFQQGLTLLAGMKTQLVVTEYWKKLARNQAEQDIENECSKCFGAGCRHCNDEHFEYED